MNCSNIFFYRELSASHSPPDCPRHIETQFGSDCLISLSSIYCFNPIDAPPASSASPDNTQANASPDDTQANVSPDDTQANVSPDDTQANASPDDTQANASPQTLSPIGLPAANYSIFVEQRQIDENSTQFIQLFKVQQSSDLLFFCKHMTHLLITTDIFKRSQSINFGELKQMETLECSSRSLQKLLYFILNGISSLTKVILHDYVASDLLVQDTLHKLMASSFLSNSQQLEIQQQNERNHRLLAYLKVYEPTPENPPCFSLTNLVNLKELRVGIGSGTNFEALSLSRAFLAGVSRRTPQTRIDFDRHGRCARRQLVSHHHVASAEQYDRSERSIVDLPSLKWIQIGDNCFLNAVEVEFSSRSEREE